MQILAEIITIGDEILLGQITDTNSQFMSARLTSNGIDTVRKTSVGDSEAEIVAALDQAFAKVDIILITGGLGPTKDDLTKKVLAKYFKSELRRDAATLVWLEEFFTRRNRTLSDINRQQADVPEACQIVKNERGTAPGMWFERNDEGRKQVVVSMPGVPHEMKHMVDTHVLPKLKTTFSLPFILHRFIQTAGVGESDLAVKIGAIEDMLPKHLRLAYLPSRGMVMLRLTGRGDDELALIQEIEHCHQKLFEAAGEFAFSDRDESISKFIIRRFTETGKTFASAESCTGGEFAARVTKILGVSTALIGTAVTYSPEAKVKLGVDPSILEKYGIVSPETAKAMANAARIFFKSDYAISSTGAAGPTSPYEGIPVGQVVLAVAGPNRTISKTYNLTEDREVNIEIATTYMTNLLRLELECDLKT